MEGSKDAAPALVSNHEKIKSARIVKLPAAARKVPHGSTSLGQAHRQLVQLKKNKSDSSNPYKYVKKTVNTKCSKDSSSAQASSCSSSTCTSNSGEFRERKSKSFRRCADNAKLSETNLRIKKMKSILEEIDICNSQIKLKEKLKASLKSKTGKHGITKQNQRMYPSSPNVNLNNSGSGTSIVQKTGQKLLKHAVNIVHHRNLQQHHNRISRYKLVKVKSGTIMFFCTLFVLACFINVFF